MYDKFREQARELLAAVFRKKAIAVEKFPLEEPPSGYGDLASSICFEVAPRLKKTPSNLAEELVGEVELSEAPLISKVKAVRGYINFFLDYKSFSRETLNMVTSLGSDFGRSNNREKIILEHTSANPDGPLHIGHARNTIIGDCLARILRFSGYDVETQFYVNDMGKQLALVVFGLRRMKLDKSQKKDHAIAAVYAKANAMVERDPTLDEEISKLMRAYEAGDEAVVSEFRAAAEYCLEGIKETLDELNVTLDTYIWESQFVRDKSIQEIIERLEKTKYARKDEVTYLDLKDFGINKELILTRRDGTYLYTTRDIAYHVWKSERGKVIDILGADHKLVAQQLTAVHRIMNVAEPEFIIYEFITLPEGGMSTRKGVYISVDELIDESKRRALAEVKRRRPNASEGEKKAIAERVGVGAVRYNIARISPEKGMVFKWEEALDFERHGSPFIQYAHARACRILEKEKPKKEYTVHEMTENEKQLVLTISKFPTIVREASEERKPSAVAMYALALADVFNRFYKFEPVLKSKEKDFRLKLVDATRIVLRNSLTLLGIDAPERM
jgi:arginyl-tRNA synthetase